MVKSFDSFGHEKAERFYPGCRIHIPGGDLAALLFGLAFAIFVLKVNLPLLPTKESTGQNNLFLGKPLLLLVMNPSDSAKRQAGCHPDKGGGTQTRGKGQA